ncbi:MAG: hypothetical protein QOG89_2904 [Thermomicrobiales bacterium]|nr:hypothetical protein [Thermomicrobiales bacterium]
MTEDGDAVVGVVERGRLSAALTAIHRGGQGHNARVLDEARGDVQGQLRRAGVTTDLDLETGGKDAVVILIHAPGRTAKTAELLRREGASAVHIVSRTGAVAPRPFTAVPKPAGHVNPATTADIARN